MGSFIDLTGYKVMLFCVSLYNVQLRDCFVCVKVNNRIISLCFDIVDIELVCSRLSCFSIMYIFINKILFENLIRDFETFINFIYDFPIISFNEINNKNETFPLINSFIYPSIFGSFLISVL